MKEQQNCCISFTKNKKNTLLLSPSITKGPIMNKVVKIGILGKIVGGRWDRGS